MEKIDLNSKVELTLLRPDTSQDDIKRACEDAIKYNFATVCVPPYYLDKANKWLQNSDVKLGTVIGFPLGFQHIAVKVEECKRAIEEGAIELDVMLNIAAIKSNDWDTVIAEIDHLATTIRMRDAVLKLIFETAYLTEDEMSRLCTLCIENEVDFVVISNDFSNSELNSETIQFIHSKLGEKVKIKTSGGILTPNKAKSLIESGTDRISTTSVLSLTS